MKIYFISGLGANRKAFQRLHIPADFEAVFLDWQKPEPKENLSHYVHRMADRIDAKEPFCLVGLSFGGIVAQEICSFLQPEKLILISTIIDRKEMPTYMRVSSQLPLHRLIPMAFFTSDKVLSYTFFRKLYNPRLPKLNEYFTEKDHQYLRWSINKIVNWEPKPFLHNKIYRMHGEKDIVFPISKIKNADIIKNGTHVMILQKSREVNKLFQKYLLE